LHIGPGSLARSAHWDRTEDVSALFGLPMWAQALSASILTRFRSDTDMISIRWDKLWFQRFNWILPGTAYQEKGKTGKTNKDWKVAGGSWLTTTSKPHPRVCSFWGCPRKPENRNRALQSLQASDTSALKVRLGGSLAGGLSFGGLTAFCRVECGLKKRNPNKSSNAKALFQGQARGDLQL
jgi:hypothetical protein